MRAFVALEVPGDVLDSLASFQRELSATGADIKLVERENLHFTVKFLGEISDAQAAEADSRLKKLTLKSARLEVKGVGAFPSPSRPRVVWAGIQREQEGLVVPTAQAVIDSLDGIGERDDRPFQLHITLARVRSGRNVRELQDVINRNASRSFGTADLAALKLKSSQLTPQGPVYRDVGAYQLT
ncbi:MAG TPA: RNA 2',3'-cyclic phosphodiesterase [Nitrososphaerales archaeon]|nr:RNA 2',3'-cyclic phosphodiesterase [Nitrososphaerales archaeon]